MSLVTWGFWLHVESKSPSNLASGIDQCLTPAAALCSSASEDIAAGGLEPTCITTLLSVLMTDGDMSASKKIEDLAVKDIWLGLIQITCILIKSIKQTWQSARHGCNSHLFNSKIYCHIDLWPRRSRSHLVACVDFVGLQV